MDECKWSFRAFGHYFQYTVSGKFVILGRVEGQWVEKFSTGGNNA